MKGTSNVSICVVMGITVESPENCRIGLDCRIGVETIIGLD